VYRNSHPIASNAYKTSASLSPSYEKSSQLIENGVGIG